MYKPIWKNHDMEILNTHPSKNTDQSTFVSPAGCPDESVLFRCSVRNSQRTAAVSLSYGVFHKMMQFYFHLEYVAFPISRAIGLYNSNLPANI